MEGFWRRELGIREILGDQWHYLSSKTGGLLCP